MLVLENYCKIIFGSYLICCYFLVNWKICIYEFLEFVVDILLFILLNNMVFVVLFLVLCYSSWLLLWRYLFVFFEMVWIFEVFWYINFVMLVFIVVIICICCIFFSILIWGIVCVYILCCWCEKLSSLDGLLLCL